MGVLKNITINLTMALAKDEDLLTLLEVPDHTDLVQVMEQITEDKYPSDLVDNPLSRICIYENPSHPTNNPSVERCWVEVDIYVTKDKNKIDRRILLIAEKVVELLDSKNRRKLGKKPINGMVELSYNHKMPNMYTDNESWTKYGLLFSYDQIN